MKKSMQYLSVALFCGFLGTMSLLFLLLPKSEFSDQEKRFLAEKPQFSPQTVLSGEWGSQVETYLTDHLPGREFFVGLNAYFDLLTGRQNTKDIWKVGDRLLEAPKAMDEAAIRKNVGAIQKFSEKINQQVTLMIVPSAGWYQGLSAYQDSAIIDSIYGEAAPELETLDLRDRLNGDCFYKTDHHWTSQGAWLAYKTYAESLGILPREDFKVETHGGFQGSAYSRSGLWLTPGEDLELWKGSENLKAELPDETHDGIFWRENLQKLDKYTVFLGGNHPIVRIHNPSGTGKLLVIRDSFSNCLGGFLAESFSQVVLIDLRYYKQPVSKLVEDENFDQILVLYGIGNFLSDKNLIFLQR